MVESLHVVVESLHVVKAIAMARATKNDNREQVAVQEATHELKLRGWALARATVGLALALALASLDQTAAGIALPQMVTDFHGLDGITGVVSAYLAAALTTVPLVTALSKRFSIKSILIVGIVVFLVGSWLTGTAPTIGWLIVFRGLQGIGAGCVFGASFRARSTPAGPLRWQLLLVVVFGLSSVAGPTVGLWLLPLASWRWIFFINVPLGVIALMLVIFGLPADKPRSRQKYLA